MRPALPATASSTCQSSFGLHNCAMSRAFLAIFLWLMAGSIALPDIAPIPESAQAALALKIIDAYHNPRPADPPRKLRIVYYTPADRDPEPDYQQRLEAIMEDIRGFYRDGMERNGFGPKTFPLERDASGRLVIHLVKGKSTDSSFQNSKDRPGTGTKAAAEARSWTRMPADAQNRRDFIGSRDGLDFLAALRRGMKRPKTFRHHSPYYGSWDQTSGLCFAADSVIQIRLDDTPQKATRSGGPGILARCPALANSTRFSSAALPAELTATRSHCLTSGKRADEQEAGHFHHGCGQSYLPRRKTRRRQGELVPHAGQRHALQPAIP